MLLDYVFKGNEPVAVVEITLGRAFPWVSGLSSLLQTPTPMVEDDQEISDVDGAIHIDVLDAVVAVPPCRENRQNIADIDPERTIEVSRTGLGGRKDVRTTRHRLIAMLPRRADDDA